MSICFVSSLRGIVFREFKFGFLCLSGLVRINVIENWRVD